MATGLDLAGLIQAAQLGRSLNPEVMQQQALGNQLAQQLQQLQIAKLIRDQEDWNNPGAANMRALQATLAGEVRDPLKPTVRLSPLEAGITTPIALPGAITEAQEASLMAPAGLDEAGFPVLNQSIPRAAALGEPVVPILSDFGQPTGFADDLNKLIAGAGRQKRIQNIINPTKPTIITSGPFAGMAIDPDTLQARDIVVGGTTLPEISRREQERLDAIDRDKTLSAEDRLFARQQELERIRQAGAAELEKQKQTGRETLSDIARQKEKAAKPLTDAQSKDLFFATQMKKANLDLQALEDKKYDPTNLSAETLAPSYFPKILRTDEKKEYDTAIENFVQSVLRKETGAAIRNDEKAWVESRFVPIAGDPPNLVKAKKENRLLVAEIVTISSQGQKMTMDEIDEAIIRARQEAGIDRSKSPSQTPVTPSDIRKKFGF